MKKPMLALAAALCLIATPAPAQDWPQQPIHIIVSFGPGGGADIIGRILADAMQERLGKPVIVENKPGAGGILGNELVAHATPDGYTLGIMTAGQIIAAVTRKEHAVRHRRVDAGGADREREPVDRDAAGFSRQHRERAGRRRQSRSGQDRVRQPRLRRHPAFRRRIVQADRRRRICCTCRSALRPKPSTPCSANTPTCCSTRSRRCSARCSPARSRRSP